MDDLYGPLDEIIEEFINEDGTIDEESLHQWFKGGGWRQAGGKYDGKPCARQPGQKTTPKCVSRKKYKSMSKKERDSAGRRKRKKDPGQTKKRGAAKPTYVKTDPQKGGRKKKKKSKKNEEIYMDLEQIIREELENVLDEKKKKKAKRDACYHKVKARYKVWPSAYASGALVKCRKVGAANWGNSKKEELEIDEHNQEIDQIIQEELEAVFEKKKTDKVESVQAAFDVLIQQLGDDANFDLIARILQQNGVSSPKDFENLSEKERDKLLDLIDVEITEKGKDPFEMLDDAENQTASSVSEAMQKIISGATTKPRVSTREKWLNIYRGDF
jgi:hypothetical protein